MNFKPFQKNEGGLSARDRILQAAHAVFTEKGPEQASVRDIIGRAGSSNATLVKYFGSKDGLLSAYIAAYSSRLAAASVIDTRESPEVALKKVGRRILEIIIPDIRSFRSAINIINKSPDLGPFIMDHSEAPITRGIAPALKRWSDDGCLRSSDPEADAERFVQLLKAGVWGRVLFARQKSASAAEIARATDEAVRIFLYGVAKANVAAAKRRRAKRCSGAAP